MAASGKRRWRQRRPGWVGSRPSTQSGLLPVRFRMAIRKSGRTSNMRSTGQRTQTSNIEARRRFTRGSIGFLVFRNGRRKRTSGHLLNMFDRGLQADERSHWTPQMYEYFSPADRAGVSAGFRELHLESDATDASFEAMRRCGLDIDDGRVEGSFDLARDDRHGADFGMAGHGCVSGVSRADREVDRIEPACERAASLTSLHCGLIDCLLRAPTAA